MISRIVVKFLGGIWRVKNRAQKSRFYTTIYNYYQFEHGSSIAILSSFESEPLFPRGMKQIVISNDVKIGKNCVIYQQVTIDNELLPNKYSNVAPIIGDNCYIYPGARIIGNVTIGDNVIVSSNAVITKDISSNSHV